MSPGVRLPACETGSSTAMSASICRLSGIPWSPWCLPSPSGCRPSFERWLRADTEKRRDSHSLNVARNARLARSLPWVIYLNRRALRCLEPLYGGRRGGDQAALRSNSARAAPIPRRKATLRPVARSSPHRNARRTQREITWYQGGGLQADQGRAGVRRGGLRGGSLVGVENGGGGRRGQSERGSKKASTIASIGSAANNRRFRSALTLA